MAQCAKVAVLTIGEMELRVDQRDSKISLATMPVPGIKCRHELEETLLFMGMDME